MSDRTGFRSGMSPWIWAGGVAFAILTAVSPAWVFETAVFVVQSLVVIAPLVVPGILLAAGVVASGADGAIARAFEGRMARAVLAAAAIGAVTPVCGVTVLPLMAGLLAARVPLAPVMAFWLASPVTDPAMLAATAATLGPGFAVGKTLAAFGLGLLGGAVAAGFRAAPWAAAPLRDNRITARLVAARPGCGRPLLPRFWADPARRALFSAQAGAITRLMLICLIPAFAAEFWLNELLQPEALSGWLGAERWYAIPLAVTVGAPAYVDGYAARR